MEKIKTYIVIIILLMVLKPGFAQETENISLDGYLEMAAKNNPELKATFNQYLASLEKVPQVGSLPDPQSSFGIFTKPMAILGGSQVANIEVMQMFPWFGTLKIAKDEASEMAKAKFQVFIAAKAELFYQVKTNWYQLIKLDREIMLVEENIQLLESLEKLAMIKFQAPASGSSSSGTTGSGSMNTSSTENMNSGANDMGGMKTNQMTSAPLAATSMSNSSMPEEMGGQQSGLQDVLRVKMEILEQQNKLLLLKDQRFTTENSFNALLNRDLNTRFQINDSLSIQQLPTEKLAIADSILNNNPMLAMLGNEAVSYELMGQKAKKMGLPMLGVGLNYMLIQKRDGNTFMMNGTDMLMPMFSVSIPLHRKKYNAMQNEAVLMQESVKQQTLGLKNNLMVQYRSFVQNLNDAKRRVTLYQQQEELAQKTTDLLLAGFTTSGTNYEEVLRMQYKVLDFGFKHIEAITDYNMSVALAEKLMGRIIW
ncbi:MAG: transporter [Bacteroidetes bacterium HGW-Bacteroidetes-17]|nr:MAG: transporter [Bacteroidetes bacterium HGW-Bacteroidetes-17]